MTDTAYAWAPITKTVREDDGTLLVYGPAASSALDRDQQRLDGTWLDSAMPRWLADGGGVREQHDPKKAVGVGVGLSKGEDGAHYLTARIVDPVAVKKIEHGVLRGFSVGIKNPRVQMGKADAPNGLVVDGDVIEVSVVDRPANPECRFDMAKADAAGDLQLVEDAQVVEKTEETPPSTTHVEVSGAVMGVTEVREVVDEQMGKLGMAAAGPQIRTKADLRKAIQAADSASADHERLRAHITKRAKALGLEAMVPGSWQPDSGISAEAKADRVEKAEEILRQVRQLVPVLAKADDEPDSGGEAQDITGACEAIAAIARLIISEAESLAAGNLSEAGDIELLLEAVRSIAYFKFREEQEDDTDMGLADTTKTDDTPAATADNGIDIAAADTGETPDVAKAEQESVLTKAEITELIKAATAEATTAAEERITALATELAKAQATIDEFRSMPLPGGPVLTRTADQQAEARKSDADRLRAEAHAYLAKADQVEDRYLRDGYRERAQQLLAKADA
ncbi:HK97 family phage prohead protease [Kitasatospora sp. NPDC001175]|uniref:hypothetical protein n=1 Tax=Kitasatospora sp. NPDC001175 TaxID=3157103 RepID=UPI003D014106